jgi:DNA polymerase elongation subunit (family B)
MDYTVIYGDTDSVFVQLKDEDPHDLASVLSAEGLELELEKILIILIIMIFG